MRVIVEPQVFEEHVIGNPELLSFVYTFAVDESSRYAEGSRTHVFILDTHSAQCTNTHAHTHTCPHTNTHTHM